MKFILKERRRSVTNRELLDDLRNTALALEKKHISVIEYSAIGSFHSSTIARRFGSWNQAINKAGLKINKYAFISPEELMLNLKQVWNKLRRQPKSTDLVKPLSRFGTKVYTARFGSWNAALRALIEYVNTGKLKTTRRNKPLNTTLQLHNSTTLLKTKRTKRNKRITITKGMRFDIFKRDKFKCRICGRSPATHPGITLHVDHWKPLSKNGANKMDNYVTLCNDCNLGKGAKTVESL